MRIGICFGHQIVAHALGGNCVANDRWEVGPARVRLTDLGVRVFGSAGSAEPEAKKETEDNEIVSLFVTFFSLFLLFSSIGSTHRGSVYMCAS